MHTSKNETAEQGRGQIKAPQHKRKPRGWSDAPPNPQGLTNKLHASYQNPSSYSIKFQKKHKKEKIKKN